MRHATSYESLRIRILRVRRTEISASATLSHSQSSRIDDASLRLDDIRSMLISRPAFLLGAIVALAGLGGCGQILTPLGPVAAGNRLILLDALAIMLCIVLPVIVLTLGFAWWYRASNVRATYRPDFIYSGRLELLVWAVPLLVTIFLAGLTWVGSHELDPARPLDSPRPALEIQVVSMDWKWLFIYPDRHVASVNELVLPMATPIHFRLTSASVMNAFFIPRLGSMIYTMNGMTTQLNLQADQPGELRGLSSQYSGEGFSDMHFAVRILPSDGFSRWIAQADQTEQKLDRARYWSLAQPSQSVGPMVFKDVAPDLFDAIVSGAIPSVPLKQTNGGL